MNEEVRQLDVMREAAFGLGMGFARAAEVEGNLERKLRLYEAFNRGFASVRLAIALAMRARREARLSPPSPSALAAAARLEAERPEAPDRPEPPESPERTTYDERDRDREDERASLPILLRTLARVADDAGTLTPQAAELPGLRELLDRVGARSGPGPAGPSPTSSADLRSNPRSNSGANPATPLPATPGSALRGRLSGGTSALTLPSRPPDGSGLPGLSPGRSSGSPPGVGPPRRSTGPPRR
ncbi:hypothetical protein [Phenylobacterium sp.]|uniref:hypothetical protein n=1 Tax=Phenylobacterium sp. TaxID=1871053 RepID=UPI00301D22CF